MRKILNFFLSSIGLILIFALVLRVYFLFFIFSSPVIDDAAGYHEGAQSVLNFFKTGQSPIYGGFWTKGPVQQLYLAFVYFFFNNPMAAKIVQALTDTLTVFLIYKIGNKIFDKKIGLLAAILYSFYPPAIFSVERLMQETFATFIFVFATYSLLAVYEKLTPKGMFLSGLVLAFLTLSRPYISAYWVFIIPVFLGLLFFKKRLTIKTASLFLVGFFIILLPWIGLNYKVNHKLTILSSGGSFSDNLLTGNSISGDGYTAYDLWPLGYEPNILHSLSLDLKKIDRLYAHPYNDYRSEFPFSYDLQKVWQKILFYTFLFAIPLSFLKWPKNIFIILPIFYTTLVGLISLAISRFGFPIMPFLFIFSAAGFISIFSFAGKLLTKYKHFFFIALLIFFVIQVFNLPFLISHFPQQTPYNLFLITILITNLFIILSLCILFFLYRNFSLKRTFIAAFLLGLFVLVGFNNQALTSGQWHEWRIRLYPGDKIRQEIVFGEDFDLGVIKRSEFLLDVQGSGSSDLTFTAKINGNIVLSETGDNFYNHDLLNEKGVFVPSMVIYSRLQGRSLPEVKQWLPIVFDKELLSVDKKTILEIELSGERNENNFIELYGDYPFSQKRLFEGPSFIIPISLIKYIDADDYRVYQKMPLQSLSSQSFLLHGKNDNWEKVNGEFRIRLQTTVKDYHPWKEYGFDPTTALKYY